MDTETKLIGVTLSIEQYDAIVKRLKPLENVQDFIRDAIDNKLSEAKP